MKRYVLREKTPGSVHETLGAHPELVRDLLHGRGISTIEDAELFLRPDFERDSHDPFLFPDMERAVDRVLKGIAGNERIAIWSDYDCDGIPGGSMLHDFFKLIGYENFTNYIPHRHMEGYGINAAGLTKLKDEGVSLVISVDSGITDHVAVAHGNALGLEIIVTDHHLPAETLPPAYAVINPKRRDNTYPFDGLSGTGVAWKLVQGILAKNRFGVAPGKEKWLLDLVGLATVADMMPLTGENRALVHFGLVVLRKSPRPGLQKLFRLLRTRQHQLTEDDIGFTIAPRINAASRMDNPEDAFHLLTTRDDAEGEMYAKKLNHLNDQRKGVVASTVKEIRKRLSEEGVPEGIIVMGNPAWRPGLLGLVAQNIMEEYGRSVCLWGRDGSASQAGGGETIKGSCRSDGSINIVELMRETPSLAGFGGHKAAGGFSLAEEHIHSLSSNVQDAYAKVKDADAVEEVLIDRQMEVSDASRETLRHLSRLAPYGTDNHKPLFSFPGAEVSAIRQFGKTGDHLEVTLSRGGSKVKAIAFYQTPDGFTKPLREGGKADVVAHLEADLFSGGGPRLRLVDSI